MATLYDLTQDQAKLYELLSNSIDEETGEVDVELLQLLDINQEEAREKCKQYAVVFKQLKADAEMYKAEEERLFEKRKRAENNAERLKKTLENALLTFGINKLEDAKVSITFRKSTKVNVLDEEKLAKEFITEKITKAPNKSAIMAAIKAGEVVDGAELLEVQNIQIK